ncbi:MAG TPA: S41 family peptidase [Stellaceae bacterium]|nr:S41 family peptidase [Stellaceae bacterium]
MRRLGLIAAIAATVLALAPQPEAATPAAPAANSADTYNALNLFGEVFEKVRAGYVDKVPDNKLIGSAINGMLTALDPHSNYLDRKDFNDMKVQTRGEFGGLGIEVSMENGLVKVVSPIDDTPAAHAGLKPGDLITKIDGKPVHGMTLPQAVQKMRGPVNSEIKLTIDRKGQKPFDVELTRAVIKIQSVKWHMVGDDVGYIRLTAFSEQTDSGLKSALAKLKEKAGNKLSGLILDLRNNPGGLLDQAVAVANAFLDKGEIVSTRGRRAEDAQRYNARPGNDISGGLPLVVLINGGSASASEIVAGALKDHHRGVLLGTRSFGKGSVQTIIPLPGHGAMRLTTARYYTPSGRSIQAEGIEPDIIVPAAKITPAAGKSGIKVAQTAGAKNAGNGSAETSVNPSIMGTDEDYQMIRAVDVLRGIALFERHEASAAGDTKLGARRAQQ